MTSKNLHIFPSGEKKYCLFRFGGFLLLLTKWGIMQYTEYHDTGWFLA